MVDPDLHGKVVLITGGNSGIGREAATALAGFGARVVITARDRRKGSEAMAYVRGRSGSDAVEVRPLDLASTRSIREHADDWMKSGDPLHVLVNNAGAILSERRETEDGFEMTFGVNHLGHQLLTELLLDRLIECAPARIVNVASIAHRLSGGLRFADLNSEHGYHGTAVYNDSKLANVLFTRELARRLEGTGVTVNCCHPGPVRSGFGGADDTRGLQRAVMVIARPFLISARRGAAPIVELASSPEWEGVTGGYFARWPWSGLPGARLRPHRPARAARDHEAARRLWEESERLLAPSRGEPAPESGER